MTSRSLAGFLGVLLTLAALPVSAAGTLLISEFRLRGPSGANDEYIEIYNNSGANHTVAPISGTGYGVAASDGNLRCTIPTGTVIPIRGHYLCVNSVAYSLGSYPSGNGTTATGDATYTTDIPDNAGIALFNNNSGGGFFSLANRFDAVGSTSEANTLYKEGTGYPALTPFSIDYAFARDECGKSGSITDLTPCTISTPKDSDNNAVDFIFVDTNGTSAGAGQRLGAPGPQNLSSPVSGGTVVPISLDSTVGETSPPNQVRDFTSDPPNNSTFGTLSIRRRFVNNTGGSVTRLRYRIVDVATFPAPSGIADLRPRTSGLVVVAGINDAATCAATGAPATPPCTVSVQGTTLEQPPSQPNGGGFNTSMGSGTVTLGTPLANGASINVQLLFGIQQTGNFKIGLSIEGLPTGGGLYMIPSSGKFQTVTACRVVDTRNAAGPRGGPALVANATRNFNPFGVCGIPPDATSLAVNVTVTQATTAGHLTIYAVGDPVPTTSVINFAAGKVRANNAILKLGPAAGVSVRLNIPSGTAHFVMDVVGYFRTSLGGATGFAAPEADAPPPE